jgi:hypothetical protein
VSFFSYVIKRVYSSHSPSLLLYGLHCLQTTFPCRMSGHCVGKFHSRKILCFAVINLASLGKYSSLNFHLLLCILYTQKPTWKCQIVQVQMNPANNALICRILHQFMLFPVQILTAFLHVDNNI